VSRYIVSLAALTLMAGSAMAADTSGERSWTGVYAGLNANWNFLSTDVSSPAQTYGSFVFDKASYGNQTGNGPGGGVQLGFDYQFGNSVVVGIQAITSVTGFDSSDTTSAGDKLGTELTSYGSLNARLGYLLQPDILAYGKGGLAFGSFKYTDKNSDAGYSGKEDDVRRQGWMLGGGVEYRFAADWSAFAEYDYTFFGSQNNELTYKNAAWGDSFKYNYDQNIGSAVVGVNYRF
jgi:opacity protein-like surface antigen